MPNSLRNTQWWMIALNGVLLLLGGAALVFVPFLAAFTFAAGFGLILVVIGVMSLFAALRTMGHSQHSLLIFVGPCLAILLGSVLWFTPEKGLVALTQVLGVFTTVIGIFQVVAALGLAGRMHWALLLINGLLTLAAGAVMLFAPGIAIFVFAIFFGVQLILNGCHLIRASMRMKQLTA
ncbi:MAG: DUF308 domain-containing protein [Planctomycetes bacterium]|nr:DUF308 domain-containing protein [Planctomycetota bacterium]